MSNKSKTNTGNFFEDFLVGQEIRHATPRTLTEADAALNIGLYDIVVDAIMAAVARARAESVSA